MISTGSRLTLVDREFQPPDQLGRFEVAVTLWLELFLNRCDAWGRWFADRPLRSSLLWTFWLSALYFMLGPASYVKVPDCGNGTLPARMIFAQEFLHGELGSWMSQSGCGIDRVMNNYRLEPHCILLGLLPGWLGYGLIMFVQRFIACYFFQRVTRDDLGFEPRVALLSGLAYSLFYQLGIHWQWDGFTLYDGLGIPGLPLLLWLNNRSVRWNWTLAILTATSMGLGLALCAPYFQTLFFPFLALFWYSWIQPAWTKKRFLLLTCTFIGWAAITAPELYTAVKYVPESHRKEIVVRSDSMYVKTIENVQTWPKMVWKTNLAYVVVAGIGLACSRLRDRRVLAAVIAIVFILTFVRHYHAFNDHILSHLGVLSCFHFHRLIYFVPFLSALAMGLGLQALPRDTVLSLSNRLTGLKIDVWHITLIAATIAVFWTSVYVNCERWDQMWRGESFQLLYRHPDLLALAERVKHEPEARVAAISDLWRPGLGMDQSHNWSVNPGVLWSYGFETTDGYQVLYSLRYKYFWSTVIQGLMEKDEWRANQQKYWANMVFLWQPSSGNLTLPFKEYYDLELLSLANTKYIVSTQPVADPDLVLLPSKHREELLELKEARNSKRFWNAMWGKYSYRPLYIYENRRCLPRFNYCAHVVLHNDDETMLTCLRYTQQEVLKNTVLMNRRDIPQDVPKSDFERLAKQPVSKKIAGMVTTIARHNDSLELEVDAEQPGIVFIANSYHPGWRATLNDAPVSIFPANHAFQGIYVTKAGKHRLKLTY